MFADDVVNHVVEHLNCVVHGVSPENSIPVDSGNAFANGITLIPLEIELEIIILVVVMAVERGQLELYKKRSVIRVDA